MLSLRETRYRNARLLSLRGVGLAGSFAALSVALLYCRVPQATPQSLAARALLLLALKYVFATTAAGLAITWLYFQTSTDQPGRAYQVLARNLSVAWLFFPALVLMFWENSPVLLALTPAVAAIMATGLYKLLSDEPRSGPLPGPAERMLFDEPPSPPGRGAALTASLCIYGAAILAVAREVDSASFFLIVAAYLLASRWAAAANMPEQTKRPQSIAAHFVPFVLMAIAATLIALLPWLYRPSRRTTGLQAASSSAHQPPRQAAGGPTADVYHAVLLWPFPPRDKSVRPPIPYPLAHRPDSSAVSLVIPFDGSYRYFETPDVWLEAKAHVAHGDPLNFNIHSADWGPLLMEAHQEFGAPIPLSCCREIQMSVRNGESRPGDIVLRMVLSDSTLPRKPAQILEPQPVVSSEPGPFRTGNAPLEETIDFTIPSPSTLKQFNQITVVFMPEIRRSAFGSRIAIRQFALVPR